MGLVFAAGGATPQASITLQNSDAKYCYTHNNIWTLTKEVTGNTVDNGVGTVTWHINATKDSSGATTFTVHGGLTVTNTGSAPATIGNIVVNLQKPNSPKKGSNAPYVSIAADVADATSGDAATSANIVAAGSQENPTTNALWGTNNYTVSGAKGTFIETAGSGALEFKDASDNSVFSLVPQPTIPVGQSITLLYDATFSTSVLPVAGTPLRVEALVTFGNAGARGGSGSTATNIDINGNSIIDTDEANVRTVPSRITLAALPAAPDECNASVTVTDTGATTTGTVTMSNPVGFDAFPAVISDTTSWDVSVDVNSGTDGGSVCNEAQLEGAACGGTLNVIVGYEDPPTNSIPIYATYECAAVAEADASDCADVGPPSSCAFNDGDYCTYGKGAYAGPGAPGVLYDTNFLTAFASGLTIGIDDGVGPKHSAKWNATTTGRANLKTALGGGGPSVALTADTVDATSISGGTLSRNTAALALNIGFNAAGINGTHTNLGSLTLCNLVDGTVISPAFTLTAAQATALNGKTISQVLADANNALGGNGLPAYVGSFGDLNELVGTLNDSFTGCTVSAFATSYLCPICP
jgi:hypothetical protein